MNTDRLLRLAAFLDTLPPERFDYRTWVGKDWQGKADLSCGTTACALGWAMTLPDMGVPPATPITGATAVIAGWFDEEGIRLCETFVASRAFDITADEAEFLFYAYTCGCPECSVSLRPRDSASAKEVATHIRTFVDAGGIYE